MSGASTMRNAIKRVTHKERGQLEGRKKLGMLEKHKDYVERANDYKKKRKTLSTLKKKADERNPDEFYHHMYNSKVKDGRHEEINRSELSGETLHLLQSQDLGYLVHKKAIDARKVGRLKDQIHLIGDVAPRSHRIFVDSEEDLQAFDAAQHFDTLPGLVDRVHNRPRLSQLDLEKDALATRKRAVALPLSPQAALDEEAQYADKTKKRRLSPQLSELKARTKRAKKIDEALQALQTKRNALRPGHKVKVIVKTKLGKQGKEKETVLYKFRRERAK